MSAATEPAASAGVNTASIEARCRTLRWWDLGCAAVLIFVAVVGVIDAFAGDPKWATGVGVGVRILILTGPAIIVGVLYVTLGRGALLGGMVDTPVSSRSGAFLALLVLMLLVGTITDPMYAMFQALAYPIVWTVLTDYRGAVLWCVAVAVSTGSGIYLGLFAFNPETAIWTALTTGIVSFVFAVFMGTWISRIHDRGETYRELAEQLRRSQGEVAALSEAAGASMERERMSRDLHDTLTQTLTGLVMLSEQTERALDAGDEARARDRLARVGSAARSAVAEARALVATTQPIGEDGLEHAIERVAAALRADTGLEIECALTPVRLTRDREVVLLRAAQEGLANARKHARAQRVVVTLAPVDADGALLRVEDDGVGPGEGAREGGFGLTGLADRVRAVGGEVRFDARAGGGSRLEVQLDSADEEPSEGANG